MARINFLFSIVMIVVMFSCNTSSNPNQTNADKGSTGNGTATMYYGGDIITMEGDSAQYAEALVVKDGKNLFAGSRDEAMKAAGEDHEMVN